MPELRNKSNDVTWYERATVGAGLTVRLGDVRMPKSFGMYVKLGVGDLTAWGNGAYFKLSLNGMVLVTIKDQLADLINPQWFTEEFQEGDKLSVEVYNPNTTNVDFAVVVQAFSS